MKRPAWHALAMGLTLSTALAGPTQTLPARGTIQAAFTPGGDPGALVSQAIHKAQRQVQVQAYSFTHKRIAEALVAAQRRGIDVQMIADQEQSVNIATSLVADLARQGVPVWLDGQHAAAHDKVMIIDAGLPSACVITGSFNFTHAGQYRNAENVLLLCDNPDLAETYAANWRRHKSHAQPLRIAP